MCKYTWALKSCDTASHNNMAAFCLMVEDMKLASKATVESLCVTETNTTLCVNSTQNKK